MRLRTLLVRVALAAGLVLVLGGPTPGYIGGCSTDTAGVDGAEFCRQFRTRLCARDRAASRIDDAQRDTCLASIPSQCTSFVFPVSCTVTQASADVCYQALVNVERLSTTCEGFTTCGIPECVSTTLCGGSGGGAEPDGAFDGDMSYLEGI